MGLLSAETAFLLPCKGTENGGRILLEVTRKLLTLVCKLVSRVEQFCIVCGQ